MERSTTPFFSVSEQRRLLFPLDYEGLDGLGRALMTLSLSTGIHPVLLSQPEEYSVRLGPEYFSWKRAKTSAAITGSWSPMMLAPDGHGMTALGLVQKNLKATPQWYGVVAHEAQKASALPYREPFRIGRRTFFCNLARLGLDPWTIANISGTSLETIGRFYVIGMRERKKLDADSLRWLSGLMGVDQ